MRLKTSVPPRRVCMGSGVETYREILTETESVVSMTVSHDRT